MDGWMKINGCTGKSCVATTASQHADFASAVQGAELRRFCNDEY